MKQTKSLTKQLLFLVGGLLVVGEKSISPSMIYASDSIKEEFESVLISSTTDSLSSTTQNIEVSSSEKASDIVTVNDPVLEKVIRDELNKTSGNLLKSDLEKITTLTYSGWWSTEKISDLSGLEWAVNLTKLWLDDNEIVDLSPLSNLTKLNDLDLSDNQISDLSPLNGCTQLTRLSLSNNQIEDASPLASLIQLERLYLSYNQIANLDFLQGLSSLYVLSLDNNEIKDVSPFVSLTQLGHLYLNQNQIVDLSPLASLVQLEGLYLDQNQIVDLSPLASLVQLEGLYLDQNQIVDLSPLASLVQLKYLYLSHNQIKDVSFLTNHQELLKLDLSFNQIMSFQFQEEMLDNLWSLDLGGQSITITLSTETETLENPFVDVYENHMELLFANSQQLQLTNDLSTLLFDSLTNNLEVIAYFGETYSSCYLSQLGFANKSPENFDYSDYCIKATFRFQAPPTIEAENVTLTVGDPYDELDWATAEDEHNGTLPVKVLSSTIDIHNEGIYEVTYETTNSFGLSTTKTILVYVKEPVVTQPDVPEEEETPTEPTPPTEVIPPTEIPDSEVQQPDSDITDSEIEEDNENLNEGDQPSIDQSIPQEEDKEDEQPQQRPVIETGLSSLGYLLLGSGLIVGGSVVSSKKKASKSNE